MKLKKCRGTNNALFNTRNHEPPTNVLLQGGWHSAASAVVENQGKVDRLVPQVIMQAKDGNTIVTGNNNTIG
jgi:hypothetical protein